jgi:hypothetical protein
MQRTETVLGVSEGVKMICGCAFKIFDSVPNFYDFFFEVAEKSFPKLNFVTAALGLRCLKFVTF